LWGTKFCDGTIEEINLIVKIDNVYSEPFIQILAIW